LPMNSTSAVVIVLISTSSAF